MKIKPNSRSRAVWLCAGIFFLVLFMAACAGGDKKKQPEQPKEKLGQGVKRDGGDEDGPGAIITKGAADTMIAVYDANIVPLLEGAFQGDTAIMPKTETFSRDLIDQLLAQEGVASFRIYFCMDSTQSKKIKVILVGVNAEGQDVFQTSMMRTATAVPQMILEEGIRRP